jgi:hypothetical protein
MLKNSCPPINSNAPYTRRLSENGYFPQSLRQAQIIILEILQCIPVVIIFAFLDLEKKFSFSDSLLVKMHHGKKINNGSFWKTF